MGFNTVHTVVVSTGNSYRIRQQIQTDWTADFFLVHLISLLLHFTSQWRWLSNCFTFSKQKQSLYSEKTNLCSSSSSCSFAAVNEVHHFTPVCLHPSLYLQICEGEGSKQYPYRVELAVFDSRRKREEFQALLHYTKSNFLRETVSKSSYSYSILHLFFHCTIEGGNGHTFHYDYTQYDHMWQIN